MSYVHEDADWPSLLQIVATATDRSIALVEKDYWVTHTLWSMLDQGFEVWFKGGTSLSKGFGLIERFSEDIDVRVDAGTTGIPGPRLSWNNTKKAGISDRNTWFDAIASQLDVSGCSVVRDPLGSGAKVRSASFQVQYPALHAAQLPGAMRPFVLLEVGRARVAPFVSTALSSWVHDHMQRMGELDGFLDNRPTGLRCIHPWVTCLEKIDAIAVRHDKGRPASDFVRHYEDAARIIRAKGTLPPLDGKLSGLLTALEQDDRKPMPVPTHPALNPSNSARWTELQSAWEAIGPLFWGDRISLDEASAEIRSFLLQLAP